MTRLASDFLSHETKEDGFLTDKAMGYGLSNGTPTGGVVTQATNRTTGVTINKICGQITTSTASLAAQASATFTVTNSLVASTDVVLVSQQSGSSNAAGTAGTTDIVLTGVGTGTFNITVNNDSTTTADVGAIVINFAVIKAVAS